MVQVKPIKVEASIISSIIGQAIGFMLHLPTKKAKIFAFPKERLTQIHMLFVFFPLIVVWLNKNKRITHLKVMHPFISFSGHKAKYILEVPYSPEIQRKLKIGQKLSW